MGYFLTFSALFFSLLVSACITTHDAVELPPLGAERCEYLTKKIHWDKPIDTLNKVSDLFHSFCYEETINIGSKARDRYKHKKYSLTKESVELFIPEGSVTDYVLESYERGYLTFLITLSYAKNNQLDGVLPELNRFYNEEIATVYNHGQDPVNALLQAVLWDNFPRPGFSSRPFWLWISQSADSPAELRAFAAQQITAIDSKAPRPTWNLTELGRFPELDWSVKFKSTSSGYFSIAAKSPFVTPCQKTNELMMPTASWFRKIAMRHSHSYHPLVNVKSWIRLPIGIAYGISTVTAGAAVMVTGCAAAQALEKNTSFLCQLSIQGGMALIEQTDDVVENTLKPDLRHWEHVPAAIHVSDAGAVTPTQCGKNLDQMAVNKLF